MNLKAREVDFYSHMLTTVTTASHGSNSYTIFSMLYAQLTAFFQVMTGWIYDGGMKSNLEDDADGILRNLSSDGPYLPSGSSGIMNMSSTNEYGSNLNGTAEYQKINR